MGDFGTSSSVQLSDLVVRDIIYAPIIIDKLDMANPNAMSGTANKIKKGKPVNRFCVVLATGTTSVTVTYLATFALSTTLPNNLDKSYWYPVDPATKEGTFEPLPALNTKAQWASLHKKQQVTTVPVTKYSVTLSAESAAKVLAAMIA